LAGLAQALAFADVYFSVNKTSYSLDADALSVLIVMHHFSTPFGFDDAIWSKYGKPLSDKKYKQNLTDPRTKQAPTLNVYNCKAIETLPNGGVTLDSLSEKGARFAVCDTATHGIADLLSKFTRENADTIYAELTAHLIHNAVLVPAGIVAIDLAQERGYSYSVAI
jgi:intracellular sulfur oxidation DsrE/DsrF family protein